MSVFKIHFFKEKSRVIDIDELMTYFEKKQYIKEMSDRFLKFTYEHPALKTSFYFTLTPKSTVPDIYRLNPKFLDVNFDISLPVLMTKFMLEIALSDMYAFSKHFNLALYHPLFEDVSPYDQDMIVEVFYMFQKAYIKKHPQHLDQFTRMDKDVLYNMSTYTNDIVALKQYFNDANTYVPKYQVIKCDEEVIVGFMFNQDVLTVIPPFATVCLYRVFDQIVTIDLKHFEPIIDKYFTKVPGTIQGTRVLLKKYSKHMRKFMNKLPYNELCEHAQKVPFENLMQKEN